MTKFIIICSLMAALTGPSCAQNARSGEALALVSQGQPNAQIFIRANASATEKYAAQELQNTLEKISGAKLNVVSSDAPSNLAIVIGTPESTPAVKSANLFNTKNREETRIVRRGQTLYLAAPTSGGALRAVYTFLQEELGARWFWPGESGEYLPTLKTISVGNLDIRQIPDIPIRSLSINSPHYDEATLVWMARNRLNLHNLQGPISLIAPMHEKGLDVMIGGHNAYLDAEVLEQHPEYIAEISGKRQIIDNPPHLCWSNAGAQKALAEKVSKWWDEYSGLDVISFFGPDHNHFCGCNQCKAYAPDVSTRWQKFSKAVIAEVNKTHPGKRYQTLAYQAYRDAPTEAAPFELIGYTTYNIDYTKPLSDPTNKAATSEIKAWLNAGGKVGLRGYQFIPFNVSMYVPLTGLIMDEVAWSKANNLTGWSSEITPFGWPKNSAPIDENWITNRMAVYAVAQTMWNAKLRPEELIRDWTDRVYGPAAAPMLDYHNAMEGAWRGSKTGLSYFLQPPATFVNKFFSDDLLTKSDAYFQDARKALNVEKNAATKSRIETQIHLEAQMLDKWRQTFMFQQGRAGRLQAYAPRAVLKPQMTANTEDPAWKSVAPLPAFEADKGEVPKAATTVLPQWSEDTLYLRFISYDADTAKLKNLHKGHDEDIFGEDEVELFLDDPAHPGHYFHLAIAANGVRYDAKADGAMNFDKVWNPNWTAKTSVLPDRWIVDLALPFASFGLTPKEGLNWKMSFMRAGGTRYPNSGWPDAAVHNPAGFGTLTLVEKVPQQKRVVLYDAGADSGVLRAELAQVGFQTSHAVKDEAEFVTALEKGADAIILRIAGGGFSLSDKIMIEKVQPFLRSGGFLMISSYGEWPLKSWLGDEANVKWDGWEIDAKRHTTTFDKGDWMHSPHDVMPFIEQGITPSSTFTPIADGWETLAKEKLQNGEESAYLLRRKVGQGTLILTSSDMGYAGGGEMFGYMNAGNAAKLVDNLLNAERTKK
jgi:hypothetical protein